MKALEDLNDEFHARYDEARAEAELAAPVFIVLSDSLIVYRGKEHVDHCFTKPIFHAIKSAAHAPVAAFAALFDVVDRRLGQRMLSSLAALRGKAAQSLEEDIDARDAIAVDIDHTLQSSIRFLDDVIANGAASSALLEAFAAETGPLLLRLTEHATRVQLASLHQAVEAELASLTAEQRGALQVIIAGDHQARVRSLGMQYFQKRFGERAGEEKRVAYAEGVDTAEEALALVGKRRMDHAIATAFFGDARRLQRDVLGDAAAFLIEETDLERIE